MSLEPTKKIIHDSVQAARIAHPEYVALLSFLEPLFFAQAEALAAVTLDPPDHSGVEVETRWKEGFPLLNRWDFPVDFKVADDLLLRFGGFIPSDNASMRKAHEALTQALASNPADRNQIWVSFLHHEMEPWDTWIDMDDVYPASLLFLARSALRPSIKWTATHLQSRFPIPSDWLRGYCPICGSLPSMLTLEGQGERRASCSWCGTRWGLHRFQCPHCDNRSHESLGYLSSDAEPRYRVQFCQLCKTYFKLVDVREALSAPFLRIEELVTLHLDLIALRDGWHAPPSPAPAVYPGIREQDPSDPLLPQ